MEIAKEYAHQHGNEYHVVWWFHGNQYLEPQFQAFVALLDRRLKLGLEDKITSMSSDLLVKTVFYEIERRGLQCLFVFDDVKNIEKLVPYVPVAGTQHLIFTTQNASFSVESIPILPFARSESLELLSDIFPNESPSELDSLADHLRDNPSSLALAAEYIR